METREQIKEQLKKGSGIELTPNSDFTKLPDEMLANAHLYDYGDKVSIQANVEMSRRLKIVVESLEKNIIHFDGKNQKLQNKIFWLTVVGVVLSTTQIIQAVDVVRNWLN